MSGFEEVDLSAAVERMLVTPYREVKVDVSITLDSGELGTFIGYRVQHDRSRGPMKATRKFVQQIHEIIGPQTWRGSWTSTASCTASRPPS